MAKKRLTEEELEELYAPDTFRFKFMCTHCTTIDEVIETLKSNTALFEKMKALGTIGGGIQDDYLEIVRHCHKCNGNLLSLAANDTIGNVFYCDHCDKILVRCRACDHLAYEGDKKCAHCRKPLDTKVVL
jgi:hypothetical protein